MEDSHEVVRVLTSRVPGVDKERVDPRNGTERCVVCDRARLRCGKALICMCHRNQRQSKQEPGVRQHVQSLTAADITAGSWKFL